MGSGYLDEVLQEYSSSDERDSRFQSSSNIELHAITVGSGVDVSCLESHLSFVGVRSCVGSVCHPSSPWTKKTWEAT